MKCDPLSELSPTWSALCWFSFIWHHHTLSKHINGNLSKTAAPERKVFFRAMWATSWKRDKLWGRQSVLTKTGMLKRLPIIEIIFHHGGSVLLPFEAPWALMPPLIIPQAAGSQSQRSCSQQIRLQTRRSGPQSKHRHTRIMQSRFLSNACHSFCSLRGISFIWSWWSAFFFLRCLFSLLVSFSIVFLRVLYRHPLESHVEHFLIPLGLSYISILQRAHRKSL